MAHVFFSLRTTHFLVTVILSGRVEVVGTAVRAHVAAALLVRRAQVQRQVVLPLVNKVALGTLELKHVVTVRESEPRNTALTFAHRR